MQNLRHWMVMAILCFSGGIIFMLPFLREVYYIPMQVAFGYDNTQMGVQMSVFGFFSLLAYFPGGWLADRFSARKLIASSLVATGLGGLYFATFPSYEMGILLHAFWGTSISLIFWAAMIKATRSWAPPQEQGRAFGILESGRGVVEVISSSVFLAVFAWLGSNATALAQVINLFAATNIMLAVLTWLILDDEVSTDGPATKKVGLAEVMAVLKMPSVWLIAIVVMTAYVAYWGAYYFAPYATDVFGVSVVLGGAIAVGKMWLKPFAAASAGFVADRFGVSRTVFVTFLIVTSGFLVLGLLPGGESWLLVMLINAAVVSIGIFALRGIYFALLEEGGIDAAVTGTAAGVISAVGFTPDVFMPLLGGVLLDAYPGQVGYRFFYFAVAAFTAVGSLASWEIMRRAKRAALLEASYV